MSCSKLSTLHFAVTLQGKVTFVKAVSFSLDEKEYNFVKLLVLERSATLNLQESHKTGP